MLPNILASTTHHQEQAKLITFLHGRYIMSLAVADLLVIVTVIPLITVVYVLDSWPWGQLLCSVSEFVKDVSIGVSIFSLTTLAANRYCAIVNPMRKFHAHGKI